MSFWRGELQRVLAWIKRFEFGDDPVTLGPGGVTTTGPITADTLRLTAVTDVSPTSTGHPFQIGLTTSINIAIDGNEIMARNNGAASQLFLNAEGGIVSAGAGGFSTAGPISGGAVAATTGTFSGTITAPDALFTAGSALKISGVADTLKHNIRLSANLIISPANAGDLYLNFDSGTGITRFADGASGLLGSISVSGLSFSGLALTAGAGTLASLTLTTPLAVAQGGTASTTASAARTALGVQEDVYTPSITNGTNVTSSSVPSGMYIRIGNRVEVKGSVVVEATAAGATSLGISLPIASNFAVSTNLFGQIVSQATQGTMVASVANDRADVNWSVAAGGAATYFFDFMYTII